MEKRLFNPLRGFKLSFVVAVESRESLVSWVLGVLGAALGCAAFRLDLRFRGRVRFSFVSSNANCAVFYTSVSECAFRPVLSWPCAFGRGLEFFLHVTEFRLLMFC